MKAKSRANGPRKKGKSIANSARTERQHPKTEERQESEQSAEHQSDCEWNAQPPHIWPARRPDNVTCPGGHALQEPIQFLVEIMLTTHMRLRVHTPFRSIV